MKRILSLLLFTMMLAATASAAPLMQDGSLTAHIGGENHLYLTSPDGTSHVLQVPVSDILGMTKTDVFARQMDGTILAVTRDGSSSAIAAALPEDAAAAPRFQLENGWLYVIRSDGNRLLISTSVTMAAHLPAREETVLPFQTLTQPAAPAQEEKLYFLQQVGLVTKLMALPMTGIDSMTLAPVTQDTGVTADSPIAMTVTEDAVTILHGDRSMTVLHLTDVTHTDPATNAAIVDVAAGNATRWQSASEHTAYAFYLNGTLYPFAQDEAGHYLHEAYPMALGYVPATSAPTATQAPTATPTLPPTSTPAPTKKPTATPQPESEYEDLKYGDTGSAVRAMQRRLKKLGYPVGSVDGDWGENTQLAVNLFQNAAGFKERKTATAKMQEKLFSSKAPKYDQFKALKEGKTGTPVRLMQQALYDLGWFGTSPEAIQEVDGHYGPKTAAAVMAFQQAIVDSVEDFDESITPTGKADRETLKVLFGTMAPMAPALQQPVPTDPLVEFITPAPSGKPDDDVVEILPPAQESDKPTDDLVEVLPPPEESDEPEDKPTDDLVDVIVPEKPEQPEGDGGVDLIVPGGE